MTAMSSNRPYLVRAMYEWIVDNHCTPHLLVDAEVDGTVVPRQFVKDGQIVLNLSSSAVINLVMDNNAVQCNARFGGVPMAIHVPAGAVLGIYARENGQGMLFDGPEPSPEPPSPEGKGPVERQGRDGGRPHLKVVKPELKIVK